MECYNRIKSNTILRYITLILFLACTATAASNDLIPNYDDPGQKLKFFDARNKKPLLLSCSLRSNGDYKLVWLKNDKEISKIQEIQGRYELHEGEHKLIFPRPDVTDAGNYTCKHQESGNSAEIRVIANVYMKKTPNDIPVVEGEKLEVHCKVAGTDPKIQWTAGPSNTLNATRVEFRADADNIANAILVIKNSDLNDRGFFNCTAENLATRFNSSLYPPAQDSAYIRVKSKFAALWPFLGICAEVFILCAIILVYEKRRNKEGLDESDTDQSPEQEKLKACK